MKINISSLLLIGIGVLIIGGMLTSSFLLKKQYDTLNKEDKYWYYNQITTKPFKHIKIVRISPKEEKKDFYTDKPVTGKITFEAGDTYKALSNPIRIRYLGNSNQDDTLSSVLKDDTLFIRVPQYSKYYGGVGFDLRITTPDLASITGVNTGLELVGYNKKSLRIDLSEGSFLTFLYGMKDMSTITASLKDGSKLTLPKMLKLDTLIADLSDKATLKMPLIDVKFLKLRTGDSTSLEAPTRLFKINQ